MKRAIGRVDQLGDHVVLPDFDFDTELSGFGCPLTYPRIENIWLSVFQSSWVSCCDVMDEFYQVIIPLPNRKYFGILMDDVYYRYRRMPQRVTNAPALFVRLMHELNAG